MNSESVLWELAAKQAIHELVLRYCRAIDRRDYAALSELYHGDAVENHGAMFNGSASDYIRWLPSQLAAMTATAHAVHNHLIEVDGEQAVGEVYCQAYHRYAAAEGEEELIIGGRYLDRYRYDGGQWRFSCRHIVTDWNDCRPSRSDFSSPMFAGTPVGTALPADISSAWFKRG